MKRLLVLGAIFALTYVVASLAGLPMTVAVITTVVVGFGWIVAHDVRRTSWAESQRSQDAAYAAAMIVGMHASGQGSADCPTGYDGGFSGGADCGGAGGI